MSPDPHFWRPYPDPETSYGIIRSLRDRVTVARAQHSVMGAAL